MTSSTMQFVETGNKNIKAKTAKKYQVNEAFKGMSFMGVMWAVFVYVYTTFELGILRTLVIGAVVVYLLDTMVPFWRDVVSSIFTSLF
jgi:hypothetical protein